MTVHLSATVTLATATSAAAAGVGERAIMRQGGGKSEKIARRYIRAGSVFRDNSAAQLGL